VYTEQKDQASRKMVCNRKMVWNQKEGSSIKVQKAKKQTNVLKSIQKNEYQIEWFKLKEEKTKQLERSDNRQMVDQEIDETSLDRWFNINHKD